MAELPNRESVLRLLKGELGKRGFTVAAMPTGGLLFQRGGRKTLLNPFDLDRLVDRLLVCSESKRPTLIELASDILEESPDSGPDVAN